VMRDANVAGVGPGIFVPFEAVLEAGSVGSRKVQTGVTDLQPFLPRREGQSLIPACAQAVGVLFLPFDEDGLDDYRRRIGVRAQLRRINPGESFDSGKPERAVARATGARL